MFQNIPNDTSDINDKKDVEQNSKIKKVFTNIIDKKNILLYIVSIMISTIGFGQGVSPFSLALVAGCFACGIPALGVIILSLIGNIVGGGLSGTLNYILILLVFLATFFLVKPKYNEERRNEKVKLGPAIFFSTLLVTIIETLVSGFTLYDILSSISIAIITFIFYKIFVNSLVVIRSYGERRAFSIEEVMGASLLLAIAVSALGNLQVFGFSVRNILSILIVLVLGWKNGMLVGTTSGVTIGVTLGIIADKEPVVIAAFALSGLVAGLLNRFGRIGVIVGFILGNGVLAYVTNGNTEPYIIFKEILIASIGLLAIPKNIHIDIEDVIGNSKFLPVFPKNALNKSKQTVEKLNTVSKAIHDMADTYKGVAATLIKEEDIKEKNKQIFITELLNNIDLLEDNMLYDDISDTEGKIVQDLFNTLTKKQEVTREDLLKIFANSNSYIVGFDDKDVSIYLEKNIQDMLRAINQAYKISKVNFIWEKKLEEKQKNISSQLAGVSKAISSIADEMNQDLSKKDNFENEKEEILVLLKQKQIEIQEIEIQKDERFVITIFIKDEIATKKEISQIENILTKVLQDQMVWNQNNAEENKQELVFISDDKYQLQIGKTNKIKENSTVSGDSMLSIRLKDGKYLIALSDGMGSGPEARKSSQIAIKMLERLLSSGFDKDTSISLINTAILNTTEEIFATLDIAIVDLYKGNIEFIKNGACPTYIKNKKRVQMLKSSTLPAGIVEQMQLTVYDRDIEQNDILVMCTDGVIDSNIEYKNKELWVKYLLEDIENENPQKIADIILQEAIDNHYGKVQDDMSILVCKFINK